MKIPTISPLRAIIVQLASRGWISGEEIRECLQNTYDINQSGSKFYRFMQRMEEANLMRGQYRQKDTAEQKVRERIYTSTAKGRKELHQASQFWKALQPFA